LRTRKRQDTEGRDRYSTEVIVDNFIFLDSKSNSEADEDIEIENSVVPEDEEVPF
jgi:single-stranded DNA-binding protein